MQGRVLIVAGSDSGGGAGVQAALKTVTALGAYGATAITALAAQNTRGVFGVVSVAPAFVAQQMQVVLDDIGADCITTGMLGSADVVEAVVRACERHARGVPLVVDPVMVARGGAPLVGDEAVAVMRVRLLPIASLVTPNALEASALAGVPVESVDDLSRAADGILALGAGAVLVKGGRLPGDVVIDLLRTADGVEQRFESARVTTRHCHGTGCTLASAVAAGVAQGLRLSDAVDRAVSYVHRALQTAPGLGEGHGPLNHAHPLETEPRDLLGVSWN